MARCFWKVERDFAVLKIVMGRDKAQVHLLQPDPAFSFINTASGIGDKLFLLYMFCKGALWKILIIIIE